MKDYCDECGGKPGGHKASCSQRFVDKQEAERDLTLTAEGTKHTGGCFYAKRSESNARIRRWQLTVALLVGAVAVVVWQFFKT